MRWRITILATLRMHRYEHADFRSVAGNHGTRWHYHLWVPDDREIPQLWELREVDRLLRRHVASW